MPAKIVLPSWIIGEVLPCIRRSARTTLPPNASPIHCRPRHTPRIGTSPAISRSRVSEIPASVGVHGPGEMTTAAGMKRANTGDIDGVVALDDDVGAEFAEVLHDVVGERVVVIDHQDFFIARHATYLLAAISKSRAAWSARTIARALLTDSSNSAPGSESATTPPPAWM